MALGACMALNACTASTDVTADDRTALTQLAGIAANDAENAHGAPEDFLHTYTECWLPSANLVQADELDLTQTDAAVSEHTFRVLCRVHFDERGEDRYRDMICIGELGRDPVADSCYQWAFYSDTATFEDQQAFDAGTPNRP